MQSSLPKLVDQPWILIMGLLLNMVKIEMLTQVLFLLDAFPFTLILKKKTGVAEYCG